MKEQILQYLRERAAFVRKGEIEDFMRDKGYLLDGVHRALRKMAQKNEIKVDYYKSATGNKQLVKYASLEVEKPKKRVLVLTEDHRAVWVEQ